MIAMPSRIQPALFLLLGSIAPLAVALASQYWGGLLPCQLCIWQRLAYLAAIALALLALALPRRLKPAGTALVALAVLAGAGIALFHAGVEQHWWKGLASCTGNLNTNQSLSDLESQLMATPIIPCDRPAWTMFGVSMAGYNFVYAAALGFLGLVAAIRSRADR
jgi:disulfide bond formation protein DsbB